MEKQMFRLLNSTNQQLLTILELISENKRWYTTKEIGLHINVTERTAQRYIHQIRELTVAFNDYSTKNVMIYFEKYRGIYLESESGYIELKNYIFEQDETIQLLKHLIVEDGVIIDQYVVDHYISVNSVKSSLKKIKVLFELYDLTLSRQTYAIIGNEKQIRLIIYIMMWTLYKGMKWPFETINEHIMYQTVDLFSETNHLTFSVIQRKQLAYVLSTNLIRLRKKHFIEMEEDWRNYVNMDVLLEKLSFLKNLMQEFNIYSESEVYFYAVVSQIKTKFYESSIFKEEILSYHKRQQSDVYLATQQFMELFQKTFSKIPTDLLDRFFITSFCAHMFSRLFKRVHVDVDGHYVINEINDRYPVLKRKMLEMIHQLYKDTGNDLFLMKDFLLQKYILLFSSVKPLTYYESEITIYLDTDLPYFVIRDIEERIMHRYKYDYHIVFKTLNETKRIDLVLTNIPNTLEEMNRYSPHVQLFDYPIKERDLIDIGKKLQLLVQEKSDMIRL
ncbi:helix-turn-helix domain-containing protein [Melissococcus sp. OM08-11BH]|uniref:helix-turn-helix domain-containing protein n=1 Tax=Melissococcus sp. OM08-11BH TaxID=2293110 RepID=UPI000E52A410|nr:helix-turn-helix domain-containing protein [Melissococcus sp. OM08-11BH]RGI31042.1 HTH domain-containing protein [Melissococcus sp. OM08-11BH]